MQGHHWLLVDPAWPIASKQSPAALRCALRKTAALSQLAVGSRYSVRTGPSFLPSLHQPVMRIMNTAGTCQGTYQPGRRPARWRGGAWVIAGPMTKAARKLLSQAAPVIAPTPASKCHHGPAIFSLHNASRSRTPSLISSAAITGVVPCAVCYTLSSVIHAAIAALTVKTSPSYPQVHNG